jgi:hypothetical protein
MKRLITAILLFGLTMILALRDPEVSADSLTSLWMVPPTVSGTVTYGNPHPSSIRPVADVDLMATGDPSVAGRTGPDRTPAWGRYALTGFGESPYTMIPSKSGSSNNFINSFDAAKIARHVAAMEFLDTTQRIVADVSGNGQIQSFDAAMVAGFVVNTPISHGLTGTWIFNPGNRSYAYIINDISGEDYTALLMGEVSGNWNNNGNGGNGGRSENTGVQEREVDISAPFVSTASHTITVPIKIENGKNKGIISYEFDLRYDPSVILPSADPVSLAKTVSRSFSVAFNSSEPGLLKVAVYGTVPVNADGALINLTFNAVGAERSVSPLTWERVMVNEGDPAAITVDGRVELVRTSSSDLEN